MNRHTILILMIAVLASTASAQVQVRGWCGHELDNAGELTLRENVALAEAGMVEQRSVVRYIPITFHYIADDNGNGYPREEQALEQLASINKLYADQEFVFYIDQIKYTANSNIYNTPASSNSEFQMRLVRDNRSMDIFVTRAAESGSGSPGVTLGYYSGANDWIVTRKDEFNGITGTMGHEIGHFFSLAHTHLGWDNEPYDEEVHGNPVESFFAPGGNRVEFQDRTNCNNAGDFICDTPPDYNFGFGWSVGGDQCATYNAGTMDPNGDEVDPMELNVMGYFIGCDEYQFSNTQKNVIRADYLSSRRSYLRTGNVPATDTVTGPVDYIFPINDEETPAYNLVELDWEDTPGANQYLVIIDRIGSFTLQPQRFIVTESELELDNLNPGLRYFWRVWPFNESSTGAGWSAIQSFTTGTSTSVQEIESVDEFMIYPNPVTDGQVTLSINSTETFDADIEIYNMSGQVVSQSRNQQVNQGGWNMDLQTDSFAPGLYIVQVKSQKGILAAKLSVQ